MWNDFILLFTEMSTIVSILLAAGLVLILIEMFLPGFGLFGGLGSILLIIGTIVRVVDHGSANPLNLFVFLAGLLIILFTVAFAFMAHSIKKGKISRTAIVENGTVIVGGKSTATEDYSFLLEKTGLALTTLRPSGIVVIEDKQYDVVATGFFIEKGETIKVVAVEGVKILVKKFEERKIIASENNSVTEKVEIAKEKSESNNTNL